MHGITGFPMDISARDETAKIGRSLAGFDGKSAERTRAQRK
jgi:hypothetical protein